MRRRLMFWSKLVIVAGALLTEAAWVEMGRHDSRPDIVLVTVDCLRSDHTGCGGYARNTTPALDALARRGVKFETALAAADWTLPSLASIMTGLHPSRHGAVAAWAKVWPQTQTLAERLAGRGYATAAFVASVFADPDTGLAQGFQIYQVCKPQSGLPPPPGSPSELAEELPTSVEPRDSDASVVADRAIRWLEQPLPGPRFLWVHILDPHYPYTQREPYFSQFHPGPALEGPEDPDFRSGADGNDVWPGGKALPERLQSSMVALYDSEVRYTDDAIGRILAKLDMTRTLVVVTGDHGEQLREHGWIGHGHSSSRQELHVPLVMAGESVPVGKTVATPVSLVDVMSTLLTAADATGWEPPDGAPLQRFFGVGNPAALDVFSESLESLGCEQVYSLLEGQKRLVVRFDRKSGALGSLSCYDWQVDPQELRPVLEAKDSSQRALLDTLSRHVELMRRAFYAGGDPTGRDIRLTPGRIEQLAALGYLR
ncbi:MAG: sulfatase [Candidatus Wallbacteria bacterium]|nr:sulfatase [Candidatus Wallbacteria bacterium]